MFSDVAGDTLPSVSFVKPSGFADGHGDAPRIPFIVVSPFTRGGHVNHSYADHVSIMAVPALGLVMAVRAEAAAIGCA